MVAICFENELIPHGVDCKNACKRLIQVKLHFFTSILVTFLYVLNNKIDFIHKRNSGVFIDIVQDDQKTTFGFAFRQYLIECFWFY